MAPRFERIETDAELDVARGELARLAFVEGRLTTDPERASLTELIGQYERRRERELIGRPR
jgi:hypothetical protein